MPCTIAPQEVVKVVEVVNIDTCSIAAISIESLNTIRSIPMVNGSMDDTQVCRKV